MDSPPSERDGLTKIGSRRAGLTFLRDLVEKNIPFALLFGDVDRFKVFNDVFGHLNGDEELQRIARDIEWICAPNPVFRFGGDEFMVVIPRASLESAHKIAAAILASQFPRSISPQGAPVLSMSIGIALFPTHGLNDETLMILADIALFKAKEGGRLADGTPFGGRNRAMAWGDFIDENPEQSARFLTPDFILPRG